MCGKNLIYSLAVKNGEKFKSYEASIWRSFLNPDDKNKGGKADTMLNPCAETSAKLLLERSKDVKYCTLRTAD